MTGSYSITNFSLFLTLIFKLIQMTPSISKGCPSTPMPDLDMGLSGCFVDNES